MSLYGDYLQVEPKHGFVSQLWSWCGRKQCNKYVSSYNRDVVCRLSHRVALPLTMIMALFSTFPLSHQGWECEYPYSIDRQLIRMIDLLSVGYEYVYANTAIKKLLRPCPSHLSSSYSCLILIWFFWVEG